MIEKGGGNERIRREKQLLFKYLDYFVDECDGCDGTPSEDGIVYIIRQSTYCQICWDSLQIRLMDDEGKEIHESDCDCHDCVDELVAGVAAMGPEDFE